MSTESEVDLSFSLSHPGGEVDFVHPLWPASGTFGYGGEFEPFVEPSVFSAIIGKSISVEPRSGNAPPRTHETPAGMINSIGLQNPGLDAFLADYLPRMTAYGVPVVVNVVGRTLEEYVQVVRVLTGEAGVTAFELNVSCPNVAEGLQFGLEPRASETLVRAVREATDRPIIAKLTPNVTNIAEQARAVEAGGADCVSLINTVRAMAIDWRQRRSILGTPMGGLSGPAIRPIALRMVWEAAQAVRIPVCGIGGISSPEHVLEFMVAGASCVQVGTHLFRQPDCLEPWLAALRELLRAEGIFRLRDIVGTLDVRYGTR